MKKLNYNKRLLIAIIVMLIISVLLCKNNDRSFVFGFPFIWLEFFHLGSTIDMIDLLNLSKYLIKIDYLLIDILLNFLVVQAVFRLIISKQSQGTNNTPKTGIDI